MVAFMILDKLGLQKFEEEYSVCPSDGERQGYAEQLLLSIFPKRVAIFHVVKPILAVEDGDGVFKQGGLITLYLLATGDDVLLAVFLHHFFQSDDIEQLAIELGVERVAVVLETLFQQMFRAEEFEEFDDSLVIASVEELFVFADVEPCVGNLVQDIGYEISCNFLIKEISFFGGKGTVVKFLEAFD